MQVLPAVYDANVPPDINGRVRRTFDTILTGAGTPTATSTVPSFIGQFYLDTAAAHMWVAVALSTPPVVGNFKQMTV